MNAGLMSAPEQLVDSAPETEATRELSVSEDHSQSSAILTDCIAKTWKWFIGAAIISAGLAFYWADQNRQYSYESESRLIFNRSSYGAPLYQSPDVHTLAAEFQSVETLSQLREQEGLEVPVNVLAQKLFINVQRGSGSCDLRFTWNSPEESVRLLDRLTEIGMKRVREVRNITIDQHIANLRRTVEVSTKPRMESIQIEYAKQSDAMGVDDIQVALEELHASIVEVEMETRNEKVRLAVAERRLDRVGAEATLVTKAPAFKDPSQGLSADRSPAVVAQRVRELKEEIEKQRDLAVAEAKLKSSEIELARVSQLVAKRLMPQSRLTALQSEVEQLRLEARGNIPTRQLEAELEDLNERLKGFGGDPVTAIESIERADTMKRDAEDEYLICQTRVDSMSEFLESLKARYEELKSGLPRAKEMAKMLEIAENEVVMKEGLADGLHHLKDTDAHGFSVMTSATPTLFPESSNFKKLFAGAFMLCMIGLSIPILGIGLMQVMPSPGASWAKRLNVPEIASITRSDLWVARSLDQDRVPESIKLAAIHLQHMIKNDRTQLVQFLGLTGRQPTVEVAMQVGRRMSALGEDVLVAVIKQPKPLEDTADSDHSDPIEVELDGEGLFHWAKIYSTEADEIMAALNDLDVSSKVVILTGASLESRSDLEMLAFKSGSIILSAPSGEKISPQAESITQSLARFDAPIIGVIS